ncbi:MAG: FecR domain-containing protein [Cyclobacteriaceae bacterium]
MHDDPYLRSLLEKLYNEGLPAAEKKVLDSHLRTAEGEKHLDAFMDEKSSEVFDQTSHFAAGHRAGILRKLQASIRQEAQTRSRKDFGGFALPFAFRIAASFVGVLLVVFAGVFAYQKYQTVVYATDFGEKETIILPDLSTVILIGNSSLAYARDWENGALREVNLQGEAWFNVTKSEHKPFVVHAGDIDIKVLGTTFTVKSYEEDESAEACLLEGRIAIQSKADNDRDEIILTPNQKATFLKSSQKITLSQVTPDILTSWRSSKLVFEDERFGEIVESIERKYGVRIEMQDEVSKACRFSATIHHESLKEVLDLFASTSGLEYRISGKAITITGKLCATNP